MESSDLAHLPGRGVQISQLAQDASLYRPGAARWWEGGGRPGGRGGGGSRTAPSAAPPAGPEKRAFGPGSWAHLGRTRRGHGGGSKEGHLLKCWSRCLTPGPPTVPETPGP